MVETRQVLKVGIDKTITENQILRTRVTELLAEVAVFEQRDRDQIRTGAMLSDRDSEERGRRRAIDDVQLNPRNYDLYNLNDYNKAKREAERRGIDLVLKSPSKWGLMPMGTGMVSISNVYEKFLDSAKASKEEAAQKIAGMMDKGKELSIAEIIEETARLIIKRFTIDLGQMESLNL